MTRDSSPAPLAAARASCCSLLMGEPSTPVSRRLYTGPDGRILESLPPTAQLWWMAERPQHVRCRQLSQWRALAEKSDLAWEDGEYTILSWLASQITFYEHSARGYKRVYGLLQAHGASEKGTKLVYFKGAPLPPSAIYEQMMADNTAGPHRRILPRVVVDGLASESEWTSAESDDDES